MLDCEQLSRVLHGAPVILMPPLPSTLILIFLRHCFATCFVPEATVSETAQAATSGGLFCCTYEGLGETPF